MDVEIGFDAVVDHFTLTAAELEQLRNKYAETRLGFAVQWMFLLWRGRFPPGRHELPDDAVDHVGRQGGVEASLIGFYDLTGRTAGRHRQEIRGVTGFRVCTAGDADKLTAYLADHVAPAERREDQVRAELLAACRTGLIEPPTPDRQRRMVRSALRQAEKRLFAQTVQRLDAHPTAPARLEALITQAADDPDEIAWAETDTPDEAGLDEFALIRAAPGNVSLESMRTETRKLTAIRSLGVPAALFADVAPAVVNTWRARAAVESPSHLRAHEDRAVRLTLLAALVHLREREITDTLVDLLNSVVHKVNATAHRKTTQQLMEAFKRVTGKENILFSIAAAALSAPDDPVRSVVYPAVSGGERTLRDLVAEFKATGPAYRQIVRTTMRASYTNHYRRGLLELATTLDFRSSNTAHQPVLDALDVVLRNAGSTSRYYPTSEKPPVTGMVAKDWQPLVTAADSRGRNRIVRTVYEICVFQALRDRLRCKEIWVIGCRPMAQPRRRPPGRLRQPPPRALRPPATAPGLEGVHQRPAHRTGRGAGHTQRGGPDPAVVDDQRPQSGSHQTGSAATTVGTEEPAPTQEGNPDPARPGAAHRRPQGD